MKGPRLVVYPSRGGYRWRLVAGNNRIVAASSEAFCSRGGARQNAYLTMTGLVRALLWERPNA